MTITSPVSHPECENASGLRSLLIALNDDLFERQFSRLRSTPSRSIFFSATWQNGWADYKKAMMCGASLSVWPRHAIERTSQRQEMTVRVLCTIPGKRAASGSQCSSPPPVDYEVPLLKRRLSIMFGQRTMRSLSQDRHTQPRCNFLEDICAALSRSSTGAQLATYSDEKLKRDGLSETSFCEGRREVAGLGCRMRRPQLFFGYMPPLTRAFGASSGCRLGTRTLPIQQLDYSLGRIIVSRR